MQHQRTKINPPIHLLQKYEPNHAIFESLWGPGLVERFDVYRFSTIPQSHAEDDAIKQNQNRQVDTANNTRENEEVIQVEIKLGSRLNGHPSIIHGGIISLLFDEAMGWARGVLLPDKMVMYVTANLSVDYRAPLSADSEVVLRVFRDGGDEVKMKFRGVLESFEGKIVYAEATGLFVRVKSKL
jgi:acyl-coenzyme A thioesterase PaaI-like protein